MIKIAKIIVVAVLALSWDISLLSQSQSERLYQAIIKEGSLFKKKELGRQLGSLGTAEAKSYLFKLLDDSYYWNQYAAVDGLFCYDDPEVKRRLIRVTMDNHMVRGEIASGLKTRMARFTTPWLRSIPRNPTPRKGNIC